MRLLFVTPVLPVPTSGGRTRLFNLIKQLAASHEIAVISFVQPADLPLIAALEPFCRQIQTVPFEGAQRRGRWRNRLAGWGQILFSRRPRYVHTFPVERMRAPLHELLAAVRRAASGERPFDVVAFEQLFLVELLDELVGVPALLAQQNVESQVARGVWAGARNPVHRLRDRLTWCKLAAFERDWVRRFPVCVAVSEADAANLRRMSPDTQVFVVPNGVDGCWFAPLDPQRDRERLLFFGTLSYGPNVDGISWFCHEILPLVRAEAPGATLDIVGADPVPAVSALARLPGVEVTGFVPDIRPKLWSATLSVVPLRAGGGTRLKILEALAAGCPVVSTTLGAEGLDLVAGRHLAIADAPGEFAQSVLRLLRSAQVRMEVAEEGRRAVVERYDWGPIARTFEVACGEAVRRGHAAGSGL